MPLLTFGLLPYYSRSNTAITVCLHLVLLWSMQITPSLVIKPGGMEQKRPEL